MRVAVGSALMLTLGAASARATSPPPGDDCRGPSIVLEPPLSHHRSWRDAAGDTRKRVSELSDVDACTRLEVEQTAGSVHVRALAADGRSVVRDLSGPSELEPTVVALLVLPPTERNDGSGAAQEDSARAATDALATAPAKPAQPKPAPPPSTPPASRPAGDARDVVANLSSASGHERTRGVELTLAGSGRAVGYLMGPGASALVDWQFGRWLLGATAHAEQATGPSDVSGRFSSVRSASVGALFGRRLVARPFYLDAAVAAPVLAVSASQWSSQKVVTTTVPGGETEPGENEPGSDDVPTSTPVSSTQTQSHATPVSLDLRAGALVRGVVPLAGRFGAALQADAEHSLGLLHEPQVSGQPAPLGWNFGVSLGVFWSPE